MGALAVMIVAGLAGWFGWKAFARERDRVASELRAQTPKPREATTLERDPATGIYRARNER